MQPQHPAEHRDVPGRSCPRCSHRWQLSPAIAERPLLSCSQLALSRSDIPSPQDRNRAKQMAKAEVKARSGERGCCRAMLEPARKSMRGTASTSPGLPHQHPLCPCSPRARAARLLATAPPGPCRARVWGWQVGFRQVHIPPDRSPFFFRPPAGSAHIPKCYCMECFSFFLS